ncbi:hypothetical protein BGZ49_008454 [Haplosporangium sp. Z 27]|nr:hypothetical protein BGZ49_008454 [Haplosporangium sp. Z 27]
MATSCSLAPMGRALINQRLRLFSTFSSNYTRKKTPDLATTATTTSTFTQQQAKNPFSAPSNSVLAYVGPHASSLRQAKSVAFVFGACGCIAVPATLFLGNTEQVLAIIAGIVSLSPSALLHAFSHNDVTKIHVQGSVSTKAPTAIKVSATDALKLTFEKLSWRGVPLQSQVLSSDLYVKSETGKKVTWTTTSAITPSIPSPSSSTSKSKVKSKSPPAPPVLRKETYRIDKLMMLSNPSFAFVMDQIEHQSRLSHIKHKQ